MSKHRDCWSVIRIFMQNVTVRISSNYSYLNARVSLKIALWTRHGKKKKTLPNKCRALDDRIAWQRCQLSSAVKLCRLIRHQARFNPSVAFPTNCPALVSQFLLTLPTAGVYVCNDRRARQTRYREPDNCGVTAAVWQCDSKSFLRYCQPARLRLLCLAHICPPLTTVFVAFIQLL